MQSAKLEEAQVICCFIWQVILGPWMVGRQVVKGQVLFFLLLRGGYTGKRGRTSRPGRNEGSNDWKEGEYVSNYGIVLESYFGAIAQGHLSAVVKGLC